MMLCVCSSPLPHTQNDEFGLNDINTRDFETGVDYQDNQIVLPDRLTHILPKGFDFPPLTSRSPSLSLASPGADHPTPFAQGCLDATPGAMYLPASLQNIASRGHVDDSDQLGSFPDPKLPQGWKSVGPQWGPLEMVKELGCPSPTAEADEESGTAADAVIDVEELSEVQQQPMKRQFNENDLQLKFQPREEFGGQRIGYVFRMGAQGLGYYEDTYSTAADVAAPAPATAEERNDEVSS
jgi:hypothetical protein